MGAAEEIVREIADIGARDRALIAEIWGEPMDGSSDQFGALVDAARVLSDSRVIYAVIGGIAVGIHTRDPRATRDVDIAVPSVCDRDDVVRIFEDAGYELRGRYAHSLNFRHPNGQPIQIVLDAAIDQAIERALQEQVAGVKLRFVTRDDLIEMKERAADDPARRPSKALQDRADVSKLRGDVAEPDEGW